MFSIRAFNKDRNTKEKNPTYKICFAPLLIF